MSNMVVYPKDNKVHLKFMFDVKISTTGQTVTDLIPLGTSYLQSDILWSEKHQPPRQHF